MSVHNFVSGGFPSTELPVHDLFFAPPGHTELALSLPALPGSRYINTTLSAHVSCHTCLPPLSPAASRCTSVCAPVCRLSWPRLTPSTGATWCVPASSNTHTHAHTHTHTHTVCGLSVCWLMQEATLFKFALCGEPNCSVLAADVLSFLWRCALSGCGRGLGAGLTSTPSLQVGKCRSLSALCFPPGGHSEFCHTA